MKNPYKTLGINKDASEDEIRKAYRKLAFETHPDRCPGDPAALERFKEIQEAYDLVSDKSKRNDPFNIEDIFENFFTQGFNRQTVQKGRDIQSDCEIEFADAANGCEININLRNGLMCEKCNGNGASEFKSCSMCNGQGKISYRQGNISITSTCGSCQGIGKTVIKTCDECNGDGISKETTGIKVAIPAGIRNGDAVRLPGLGEKTKNPGDAYIVVKVKPHKIFVRKGDDVHLVFPISYGQAVFGDKIKIPTLEGIEEIEIQAGIKNGSLFKIKRKGLINTRTGSKGDFVVELEIDTSMPENEDVKEIVKKLINSQSLIDKLDRLYSSV